MPVIDIYFSIFTIILVGLGVWRGLLYGMISLVGTVLGVLLASWYVEPMAGWLIERFDWAANLSRIAIFVVSFILIMQIVRIAFWGLKKVSRWFNKIPLLGWTNRLLGGIFGFVQAVIILGMLVYVIERFPLHEGLMNMIAGSNMAPYLLLSVSWIIPFLPEAWKALQSTVDYTKNIIK